MSANQKTPPEGPNSPWPGFLKFVWIMIFGLLCLLVVQRMVHYRFFSGGYSQIRHDH